MLAVAALATVAAAEQPWMNKADPPGTRAKALLERMTLEEKLVMLHGDTNKTGGLPYVGNVPGNTRLKIPPLTLNDGPQVKCALLSPCRSALYLCAECSPKPESAGARSRCAPRAHQCCSL